MSEVEVSKNVFFSGVWRSQEVNDQLLRQISNQNTKKKQQVKGSPAVLNLSNKRLDVLVLDEKGEVTRTDQIPLHDIIELTANKYAATCVFAIVRDNTQKQFYIFVFLCASDQDAGEIIQGYARVKQRLSGEGFNTDIKGGGVNWTLQPKQEKEQKIKINGHVSVVQTKQTPNGDVRIVSTEKVKGETRIETGGSPDTMYSDRTSITESEMKDELHHLADEIRDIKMMLGKSQGRHKFEKHYQYLLQDQHAPSNNTQVITTKERVSRPSGHYVVVERPVENEKQRLGSTTIQAGPQHIRSTVVQQPSSQVHQYRSTVVQPAPQYRTTIVQPTSNVQYVRRSTEIDVPEIKHYRSTRSTTSSMHSGYSKRVYDSPNPVLQQNRKYVKHQQPRVVTTKRIEQGVPQNPSSNVILIHSPSDKVVKKIENVYKNRSYRMHGGQRARPTAEYVIYDQAPRNKHVVVHQDQGGDEKVKQYIEEKTNVADVRQTSYEPEIRHVYENIETSNENEVTSEQVESVSKPTVIVTEDNSPATVGYDEQTTTTGEVTIREEGDVIVIPARTDAYNTVVTEDNSPATAGYEEQTTTTEEVTIRQVGDVIVIPARTDAYNTVVESETTGETERPTVNNNNVYIIKAEGIDEVNARRPTEDDGLFESYVSAPEEGAGTETIVRDEAYRYHDDGDYEEVSSENRQDERRVHYTEESIIINNDDDDEDIKRELVEINGDAAESDGDDYNLNEDEMRMFARDPDNLVVIDKMD